MNSVLRHLAVRIWATALFGAVACMVVLPFWQSILKVQWAVLPAGILLVVCFFMLGWVMNGLGMAKIQRMLQEAATWERAGGVDAAEESFEGAIRTFDSFWLSPGARRQAEEQITARMARFYLSLPSPAKHGRELIQQYLIRHPQDVVLARSWLEQMPCNPEPDPQDDVVAAHIGDVLSEVPDIQLLLMQYYLAAQRGDYEAMQTYRRAWHLHPHLPDADLHALGRVLMKNNQLNDWALQIYLKGYDRGEPYYLDGIAAAARFLRLHPGNQRSLEKARTISQTLDAPLREKAARRFKPTDFTFQSEAPQSQAPSYYIPEGSPPLGRQARRSAAARLQRVSRRINHLLGSGMRGLGRSWTILRFRLQPALIVVICGLAAVIAVMAGLRINRQQVPAVAEMAVIEQPQPLPVEQPFTIQVAAYLNPDDALRYVAQLQKQGLEAFSTQAVSAHRKWFQVKVSRFETKMQAREYGEKLKNSGLIDDFYVANYQQR